MKELKEKNATESRRLIQSLFDYLCQSGVKAELQKEQATRSASTPLPESVIRLRGQNLDTIRLVDAGGSGCAVPGSILRFQYEIHLDLDLTADQMKNMSAVTELTGGGRITANDSQVVGVKWNGQRLAGILNQDSAILDDLMRFVRVWPNLEFKIRAMSSRGIFISGPKFTNPAMIAALSRAGIKKEIEGCLFGYGTLYETLETIARQIKAGILTDRISGDPGGRS